jgi:surface carbohydrate biosynthesis protein
MNVIISVESQVREWDSQILLGAELAKRGCQVTVAYDQFLARCMTDIAKLFDTPLLLVDKSASISCLPKRILPLRRASPMSKVAILFQEGWLADSDVNPILKIYTASNASNYVDKFLVFGKDQARKLIATNPELLDKISITGSPRFDLSSSYSTVYKEVSDSIKTILGPFTLITDPFVCIPQSGRRVDSYFPPSWINDPRNTGGQIESYAAQYMERTQAASAKFVKRIEEIVGDNPNRSYVYRAHPGSADAHIRDLFRKYSNLRVDKSLPVEGWIGACEAMLTHVCTTAAQGLFWGRDVKILKEIGHPYFDGCYGQALLMKAGPHGGVGNLQRFEDNIDNVGFAHIKVADELMSLLTVQECPAMPDALKLTEKLGALWANDVRQNGQPQAWKWSQYAGVDRKILEEFNGINNSAIKTYEISRGLVVMRGEE